MKNRNSFIQLLTNSFAKVLTTVKSIGAKWTLFGILTFMLFVGGIRLATSDFIPKFIEERVIDAMDKRDKDKITEEKNFILMQQSKIARLQSIVNLITEHGLCNHASIQVFHDGTKSMNKKVDFQYAQLFVESSNDTYKVHDNVDIESTTLSPHYAYLVQEPTHSFSGTLDEFREIDIEFAGRLAKSHVKYLHLELFYDADGIMFYMLAFTWNDSNEGPYDVRALRTYRNQIDNIMQN